MFVSELEDETGGTLEDVLLAYVAARDSFGLLPLWGAIEALPASVPGELQTRLLVAARDVRGARHALVHDPGRPAVPDARHGVPIPARRSRRSWRNLERVIGPRHAAEIDAARAEYEAAGVAPSWRGTSPACRICSPPATSCAHRGPAAGGEAAAARTARVYFALDSALDLPWLRPRPGHAAARALGPAGADRPRGRPVRRPARA